MPILSSGERWALRRRDGRFGVPPRDAGAGRRAASTITVLVMKGRGGTPAWKGRSDLYIEESISRKG